MAKPFSMNYRTYDTSQGFGSPKEWKQALNETMGFDEATRHMGGRSPWEVLDVAVNAAWTSVLSAFRAKLRSCHPDRCSVHGLTQDEATTQSRILIAAFTLLKTKYGK